MDDDALKRVPKFKYLGSRFTEDGRNKEDILKELKKLNLCLIKEINYSVRISLVWK
jgi:hypothetical protein